MKRFSPTNKVLNQSLWLLSSLQAALFARQESQMKIGFSMLSTLAEGSKCFWNHSNCGHPRVLQRKLFDFDSLSSRKNMQYQRKSDQRQTLHLFSLFVDRFNAVKLLVLFGNLLSLMSVGEFCFGDRSSFPFLMAVTCSSCIVTALAMCRVSVECLLTKNGTRNFLKVFWSWNWFCCLPTETAVFEQLSSTKCQVHTICDNAFTFNFPTCCCETFDFEFKANPKLLHRWEYIRDRYQTALSNSFNCKLRAPQLFIIGFVRRQNRRDSAFLRLFYTSFFSLPKTKCKTTEEMHCLDHFVSWQIRRSKSCGALSLQLKLFGSAL